MANAYRFGFNGQEKDNEIAGMGNSMSAEYWQYDARLGRRWNIDPITYPWQSTYAAFNNNPIVFADPLGLEGEFGNFIRGVKDFFHKMIGKITNQKFRGRTHAQKKFHGPRWRGLSRFFGNDRGLVPLGAYTGKEKKKLIVGGDKNKKKFLINLSDLEDNYDKVTKITAEVLEGDPSFEFDADLDWKPKYKKIWGLTNNYEYGPKDKFSSRWLPGHPWLRAGFGFQWPWTWVLTMGGWAQLTNGKAPFALAPTALMLLTAPKRIIFQSQRFPTLRGRGGASGNWKIELEIDFTTWQEYGEKKGQIKRPWWHKIWYGNF